MPSRPPFYGWATVRLKPGILVFLALILTACAPSRKQIPVFFTPETPISAPHPVDRDAIVATAKKYLGTPYRFGSRRASATDCSGFVQMVFGQHHIALPRDTRKQARLGNFIADIKDLQPGDLLFFETYRKGPSHVGIYIGNDQFIHASSASRKVILSRLSEAYYVKRFLGAKNIL